MPKLFAATTYENFDAGNCSEDAAESEGAMAVCSGVAKADVSRALADTGDARLVVAATYSDRDFMVAGPRRAVAIAKARLEADRPGASLAVLKDVRNGYHSPLHVVRTDADAARATITAPSPPTAALFSCAVGGRRAR